MPGFSVDEILGLKAAAEEEQKSVGSLKTSQHQRTREGKIEDSVETFSIEGPLKIIKYSNGTTTASSAEKQDDASDVEEVLEYDEETETLVDEDDGMSSGSECSQGNRRE